MLHTTDVAAGHCKPITDVSHLHDRDHGRTDRRSGGNDKLLLQSRGYRRAADLGHAFLHHLLHLPVVQQGERDLVHPQVGPFRRPRHLLESHVGVGVLLSATREEDPENVQNGRRAQE